MKNEKHSKIIEQIRKLFSLSKSPNEHEASLALEKARILMLKYNIENIDLVKEDISDIIEIDFEVTKRFNAPFQVLSYWVGQAFFIKPIMIRSKSKPTIIKFIGSTTDVATGTYVFSYISSLMENKSTEYLENYKKKNVKMNLRGKIAKIKKEFCLGFSKSISSKLEQMKKDHELANKYETEIHNQLVICKNQLITKHINETFGKVNPAKKIPLVNDKHFSAGIDEGKKHNIYRGLEKKEMQLQIS